MAKNQNPREAAEGLTAGLRERAGPNLRSVLLHGSVARDEAVAGVSDVNVLVLLDEVGPEQLRAIAPLARGWLETAGAPPLIFAEREWGRAVDVFAIEISDMKDAHELLFGMDPLPAVEAKPSELRLQTERELRGKLLQLREGTLVSAESPKELGWLLTAALPSFTAFMRAILRLEGVAVPKQTFDVITEFGRVVGGNMAPFLSVWDARQAGRKLEAEISNPLVDEYYQAAERMADHVDRLP